MKVDILVPEIVSEMELRIELQRLDKLELALARTKAREKRLLEARRTMTTKVTSMVELKLGLNLALAQ